MVPLRITRGVNVGCGTSERQYPLQTLIDRALGILAFDDTEVVTGCCLLQRALSRMLTLV